MTAGSLVTALGFGAGALVFYRAARRRGQATEAMGWVALAGLAGGVLGARVAEWTLVHWPAFAADPAGAVDPRLGGRTLIGGLIGGWLAVETAKWRLGIRHSTGDLFALALAAGEAVGRLGCYLNGCCYGTPAAVPWAVYQHEAWRHPAQLYAAATAGATFGVLWAVRDRMPREGDLFRLYLALFAVTRFLLEFSRQRSVIAGGLSLAQWVCLELLVTLALAMLAGRWAAGRSRATERAGRWVGQRRSSAEGDAMKPFLRLMLAGLIFLFCLALGTVGGCFLGLIGGASSTSTILLLTLLGAVAGLLAGAFLVSAYLNRLSR